MTIKKEKKRETQRGANGERALQGMPTAWESKKKKGGPPKTLGARGGDDQRSGLSFETKTHRAIYFSFETDEKKEADEKKPTLVAQQRKQLTMAATTTTRDTGRADVLVSLLQQAGVSDDVQRAFCDMPQSRVLAAFACGKCAPPDGHALCLADQMDHRTRRWSAFGRGKGGDAALLAPAGYADRTLLGACIRALVPANVIFTMVDAILHAKDAGACDNVWVCADRRMMARNDRTPSRLCKPSERDRTRLRAWAWLDAMAGQRAKGWRADAHAFGPCWEAVARPCASPSNALLLGVTADMEHGCCREVDAAELARSVQKMKDDADRPKSRTKRLVCPHDARIVAFIERPLWSDDPVVCNVFVEGDAVFAIAAEWAL